MITRVLIPLCYTTKEVRTLKVYIVHRENGKVDLYLKRTRRSEGNSVDVRGLPRTALAERLAEEVALISHPRLSVPATD